MAQGICIFEKLPQVIPLTASQEIHFLNCNYILDVHFRNCPTAEYSGILKATFEPHSSHPVLLIVPEYVFTQSAFYEVHKDIFTQQVTGTPKVSFPQLL